MKQSIIIFGCLLLMACKKSNPVTEDYNNKLYYIETQCSTNPWNRQTSVFVVESDRKQIKNWLNQNGITPFGISITERTGAVCAACTCPTGRTVWVVFSPTDIEKAKSLGFRKL